MLLLLLMPQHPHDVPETDDGLDRRRRGFPFAATIDARRARRVVGGELAEQFDLPGAPERRRDADPARRIAQRLDFGIDRFQERRRVEIERVSQRPGRHALQSFGAVQIDDEMMAVRTDATGLLDQRRHLAPLRNPPAQPERVVRGELPAVHQFEQQDMDILFLQRGFDAGRVRVARRGDRMMRPALGVRELIGRMELGPNLWNRRFTEERPQQELDLPVPEQPQDHRRRVLAPASGAWLVPHVGQESGKGQGERLAQLDGRPPVAPLERLRLRVAAGVIDEQGVAERARPLVKGEQRAQ